MMIKSKAEFDESCEVCGYPFDEGEEVVVDSVSCKVFCGERCFKDYLKGRVPSVLSERDDFGAWSIVKGGEGNG